MEHVSTAKVAWRDEHLAPASRTIAGDFSMPSLTVIGRHRWHRHCGHERLDRVFAHESVRPKHPR